jgi:hypothetical protein
LDLLTAIEKEVVADFDLCAATGHRAVTDLDVLVLDATAAAFHCQGAQLEFDTLKDWT